MMTRTTTKEEAHPSPAIRTTISSQEADIEGTAQYIPPSSGDVEDSSRNSLPKWRKYIIVFITSWMTLVVAYSTTSLLPATPEIATEFSSAVEIINVTNAGVLIAMGLSSFIWGPTTEIIGRRNAYNSACFVLLASTIGVSLSPNVNTFIAMRILSGFEGSFFMVAGQTIIADIFEPVCCDHPLQIR